MLAGGGAVAASVGRARGWAAGGEERMERIAERARALLAEPERPGPE